MGLLASSRILAIASLAACYSPEVRDCTVSCAHEGDCASGQVCGSDGLCAVPERAGTCSSLPSDAGPGIRDAAGVDANVDAVDAAVFAEIHVEISSRGRVEIDRYGACDHAAPQNGDCWVTVRIGENITAHAVPEPEWRFVTWTDICQDESTMTCTFTAAGPTTLGAKFRREDD